MKGGMCLPSLPLPGEDRVDLAEDKDGLVLASLTKQWSGGHTRVLGYAQHRDKGVWEPIPPSLRSSLHAWTSVERFNRGRALMDFPTFSRARRSSYRPCRLSQNRGWCQRNGRGAGQYHP